MQLEFSRRIFEKNTHMSNFIEIRPVGAELFHSTDMTKLTAASRNLANAPVNGLKEYKTLTVTSTQQLP